MPKALVGCWEISLQPWHPPMRLAEDTIYSTPPKAIEIQGVRGTEAFETRGWRVRTAPGVPLGVHSFSFVAPLSPDSVRIIWTTGFSGLTMLLELRGDTVRGQAETFWDFDRPHQTADAMLTRVPCR